MARMLLAENQNAHGGYFFLSLPFIIASTLCILLFFESAGLLANISSQIKITFAVTALLIFFLIYSGVLNTFTVMSRKIMVSSAKLDSLHQDLKFSSEQLQAGYLATFASFVDLLEAKDAYTAGHSRRVAQYTHKICQHLGLDQHLSQKIEEAALLHDLGKVAVPEHILHKPGPLESEEWDYIKKHSMIGAEILHRIPSFADLEPFVLHHHEGYASNGYPDELQGGQIPLGARVLAVADAFDALTSERPYRSALSHNQAFEILITDKRFDPKIIEALKKVSLESARMS